jgi:hypothetical protein
MKRLGLIVGWLGGAVAGLLLTLAPIASGQTILQAAGIVTGSAASLSSLALNGCTLGANALCATGGVNASGSIVSGLNVAAGATANFQFSTRTLITAPGDGLLMTTKNAGTQNTVATLQACIAGLDGARSFVTDATVTTFASAVAGSGANHVPVYCDGPATAWKIG